MLINRIFNYFKAAITDPISVLKLTIKVLGAFFGFIIAAAALVTLFSDKFPNFKMYDIPGLIYIIFFPIIFLVLLFANAYIIKKEIKIKRWLRVVINFFVVLIMIFWGIWLHYSKRTTRLYFISEGYIYSTEIVDKQLRAIYAGTPECLDINSLKEFESELPKDPFEMMPTVLFRIPMRIRYGEYSIQIIFGRNAYKDTLYQDLYLSSGSDTLWIRSQHLKDIQ